MEREKYTKIIRSSVQEPVGILTIEAILALLYLFGIRDILILIAALAFFFHWLLDFLTVNTQPYLPVSDKIVCLFFKTKKQRWYSEILLTMASFVIFLAIFL